MYARLKEPTVAAGFTLVYEGLIRSVGLDCAIQVSF